MRALVLTVVLGLMSLGSLALTPSHVEAREWRGYGDHRGTYGVRWRGGTHWRGGWYGGRG
jgi:hypothetical protein